MKTLIYRLLICGIFLNLQIIITSKKIYMLLLLFQFDNEQSNYISIDKIVN